MRDVELTTTRGDGPGGQNRNKVESEVIAVHRPTGERVRIGTERSQLKNKQAALQILAERVRARADSAASAGRNASRRAQVGRGERGDKVRTYRSQDDRVVDHRDGRTWRLSRWTAGEW